ncbi:MAG: hypothetical protein AAGI91_08725 [Bacteroidota bacterium]
MARVFTPALAVIAATLGYLMDNVWLLGIGTALLALALLTLLVLAGRRRRRRAAAQQREASIPTREEEMRSLGISNIRPKGQAPPAAEPDSEPAEEVEVSGGAAATPEDGPLPERRPPARRPETAPPPVLDAREDSPFWRTHSPTAITSLLRALWAATDVQTVALFSTDASGTTLEAALSHNPAARRDGRFPAGNAFLDAILPSPSLTVLGADDPLLRAMPHYRRPVPLGGSAVLPVCDLDDGPVHLVADLGPDHKGFTERQRGLLTQYAGLLGAMLAEPEEAAPSAVPTRRSIIAEEMGRARDLERPLALALVYQSDAERVDQQGPEAVAEAERVLLRHLEDVSRGARVERFGELMAGVFLAQADEGIEAWAARVRARAGAEGLPLVTGIARLTPQHRDADALRADAANALQEALAAEEHHVIG